MTMQERLDLFTVQVTDSIRTAMTKISENRLRVVVVLAGRQVVGTASDGDIRRALLRDVLPMAPIEKIMNINCRTTTERDPERQADIIRREMVTVLPVVDAENQLLDVIVAYEPFERPPDRTDA
jgi:CBS domain-containing protein